MKFKATKKRTGESYDIEIVTQKNSKFFVSVNGAITKTRIYLKKDYNSAEAANSINYAINSLINGDLNNIFNEKELKIFNETREELNPGIYAVTANKIFSKSNSILSYDFLPFKHGDFLAKSKKALFSNRFTYIKVKTILFMKDKSRVIVNGYNLGRDEFLIIDENEKLRLDKLLESCNVISETRQEGMPSHIREDNGELKISYNEKSYKQALFLLRNRNPDISYEAYRCPVCNEIHIGKTKINENHIEA